MRTYLFRFTLGYHEGVLRIEAATKERAALLAWAHMVSIAGELEWNVVALN